MTTTKDLQSKLDAKADADLDAAVTAALNHFYDSMSRCGVILNNIDIQAGTKEKPFTASAWKVIDSAVRQACDLRRPQARERATKEFMATVERLADEVDELRSVVEQ